MKYVVFFLLVLGLAYLTGQSVEQKPAAAPGALDSKTDAAATPLTTDEYAQLAVALMQAQSARIVMLENLAAKKAGNDDLNNADKAAASYTTLLVSLIRKHQACEQGQWNFISKTWMCPAPADKPQP